MSDRPSHDTTHALEALLRRYLAAWGGSILRGAGGAAHEEIHLVYVVGFAAAAGPAGEAPELSALHSSLQVLDTLGASGVRKGKVRTNAVLVEEDPVQAARLIASLGSAGLSARVCETRDLEQLAPGGIAVLAAGFDEVSGELLRYTAPPRRALYVLDPPAPRLLPLQAMRPLVQQAGGDLVIRFPTAELHKQARFRGSAVADLPPYAKRIVEGYSLLFGDARYEWLSLWRAAEKEGGAEGAAVAEARMLEHYRTRLTEIDAEVAVRWVPLAAPGADAGTHYLFLAMRDPERALLMNRVLHAARLAGEVAWGDALSGFVRVEESGVIDLFGQEEIGVDPSAAAPHSRTREVNLTALAHEIATTFAGQTVLFREVLMELVDTDLFVEEIKRALSLLKRDGRADYASLNADAEITFATK
ncbi:MAG TPA: hypothetical protein VGR27_03875 [Longimicrobiaceae bacterium]|nr:hypothetical protein [Longimicrobiaceae bacterium]